MNTASPSNNSFGVAERWDTEFYKDWWGTVSTDHCAPLDPILSASQEQWSYFPIVRQIQNPDAYIGEPREPLEVLQDAVDLCGEVRSASEPLQLGIFRSGPAPTGFIAVNTPANNAQDTNASFPRKTRSLSTANSTPSPSAYDRQPFNISPELNFWGDDVAGHRAPKNPHSDSLMASSDESLLEVTGVGRGRRYKNVKRGSERARYLQKNRNAANKCRAKQKQQEEDLIESAREMERKNNVLKAEIQLLKADLIDLMERVVIHGGCPDIRLQKYVQREADRLAAVCADGTRSRVA